MSPHDQKPSRRGVYGVRVGNDATPEGPNLAKIALIGIFGITGIAVAVVMSRAQEARQLRAERSEFRRLGWNWKDRVQ